MPTIPNRGPGGRKKKIQIKLSNESFIGLAQETYNQLETQRSTAIGTINENKRIAQVEDIHDLATLSKANTDLLKIVDSTLDKKINILKLMSSIVNKENTQSSNKEDESISAEDISMIRDLLKNEDE